MKEELSRMEARLSTLLSTINDTTFDAAISNRERASLQKNIQAAATKLSVYKRQPREVQPPPIDAPRASEGANESVQFGWYANAKDGGTIQPLDIDGQKHLATNKTAAKAKIPEKRVRIGMQSTCPLHLLLQVGELLCDEPQRVVRRATEGSFLVSFATLLLFNGDFGVKFGNARCPVGETCVKIESGGQQITDAKHFNAKHRSRGSSKMLNSRWRAKIGFHILVIDEYEKALSTLVARHRLVLGEQLVQKWSDVEVALTNAVSPAHLHLIADWMINLGFLIVGLPARLAKQMQNPLGFKPRRFSTTRQGARLPIEFGVSESRREMCAARANLGPACRHPSEHPRRSKGGQRSESSLVRVHRSPRARRLCPRSGRRRRRRRDRRASHADAAKWRAGAAELERNRQHRRARARRRRKSASDEKRQKSFRKSMMWAE